MSVSPQCLHHKTLSALATTLSRRSPERPMSGSPPRSPSAEGCTTEFSDSSPASHATHKPSSTPWPKGAAWFWRTSWTDAVRCGLGKHRGCGPIADTPGTNLVFAPRQARSGTLPGAPWGLGAGVGCLRNRSKERHVRRTGFTSFYFSARDGLCTATPSLYERKTRI